jgi:hypothetical protein
MVTLIIRYFAALEGVSFMDERACSSAQLKGPSQ